MSSFTTGKDADISSRAYLAGMSFGKISLTKKMSVIKKTALTPCEINGRNEKVCIRCSVRKTLSRKKEIVLMAPAMEKVVVKRSGSAKSAKRLVYVELDRAFFFN